MGKHYEKEVYDKIDELLKQGVGNKKITEILDVSIGAVTYRKEKLGLNKRRPPKITHEQEMEIIHLKKTTSLSQEEIGKIVGVGHSTVSRVCIPYFKAEKEEQDRKIVEMSKQGYYAHEIADELGISEHVVGYRRRLKLGVSGDEVFEAHNKRVAQEKIDARIKREKEDYEQRLSLVIQTINDNVGDDWEYDSGFISTRHPLNIKCKHCGNVVEMSSDTIRGWRNNHYDNTGKSLKCDVCESIQQECVDYQAFMTDSVTQYEIDSFSDVQYGDCVKKELHICEWCGTVFYGSGKYCSDDCFKWDSQQKREESFVSKKVVCKCCGKEFMTEYKKSKVFCSEECAKKQARKQKRMMKRLRKHRINSRDIDTDVTLGKLIQRDKGICQICGKPVDENDYHYNEDGYFVCGNNYPSLDHIRPLAKGGSHTWDNVQLAHFLCNALKSDTYTSPRT